MTVVLFLGLILTGVAVVFGVRTFTFERLRKRETLAQIGAYGFGGRELPHRERASLRQTLDRFATLVGGLAFRRRDEADQHQLRILLRSAGFYRTLPETFLGYRIGITASLVLFWLWLIVSAGAFGFRALLLICMAAGLGWVLPVFVLRRKATKRLQQIDREMPELVDLLVTTVEAGVGFAASLQLVARRVRGPLGQELRLALQEQNMGLTIEEALEHVFDRVDTPSLRAFVQAIVQGQTLGVSIGKILRDLAVDMRKRRRQAAEERAQKAPTKILFPLVILILPALLIVALYGPLVGLVQGLAQF